MKNSSIQVKHLDELANFGLQKIVVAIGVFDGVHLGHKKLIKKLLAMAKESDAEPVVITFYPHPKKILYPEKPLNYIYSPDKKTELLGDLGVKAVLTIPFSKNFAELSPDDFIKQLVTSRHIELLGICVGSKWKFGADAAGNAKTLHEFAEKYGFKFKAVKEAYLNGKIVSSTAIRTALANSEFELVNRMLGRSYYLTGRILKTKNGIKKTCLSIKFGILPHRGRYLISINKRIKTLAHVISDHEIIIEDFNHYDRKRTIEFQFLEKL